MRRTIAAKTALFGAAFIGAAGVGAALTGAGPRGEGEAVFTEALTAYVEEREAEFAQIGEQRRAELEEIGRFVRDRASSEGEAALLFVCTHNSRRSHLAQVWTQTAAAWYGVEGVATYSGGTEATAFNARAVGALERAGFVVSSNGAASNPEYAVRWHGEGDPMHCFSKVYDHADNPKEGFAAVMVCTDADEACPVVTGCAARFSLPYVDPKVSDGTAEESATYDERCRQIAREMLYMMSAAK